MKTKTTIKPPKGKIKTRKDDSGVAGGEFLGNLGFGTRDGKAFNFPKLQEHPNGPGFFVNTAVLVTQCFISRDIVVVR
jgi:hypothetical protein